MPPVPSESQNGSKCPRATRETAAVRLLVVVAASGRLDPVRCYRWHLCARLGPCLRPVCREPLPSLAPRGRVDRDIFASISRGWAAQLG